MNEIKAGIFLPALMIFRHVVARRRISRRSNLLVAGKSLFTGISASILGLLREERPCNDIVLAAGEGTYIFLESWVKITSRFQGSRKSVAQPHPNRHRFAEAFGGLSFRGLRRSPERRSL
jgi:hypothetical protein